MKSRHTLTALAASLALVLPLAACASSGSGGGGEEADTEYQENFGRLLLQPLDEGLSKITAKHQIGMRRTEAQHSSFYYESEWQPHPAPEAAGMDDVIGARGRLILEGRRVGQTLDGAGEYRVTFTAQYQERTSMNPDWHPAPASEAFLDFWQSVASDLRLEVRAGVRR